MKAFYNDDKMKFLSKVRAHEKAGHMHSGAYYHLRPDNHNFVSAAMGDDDYDKFSKMLGIPYELVWLGKRIFINMGVEKGTTFTSRFLEAIAEGADLSKVIFKFIDLVFDEEMKAAILKERNQNYFCRAIDRALYEKSNSLICKNSHYSPEAQCGGREWAINERLRQPIYDWYASQLLDLLKDA